jgi:O-succinylbenzoic acid--CoA ligase
LERLLRDPTAVAWLKSFRVIFLGGAPAWPDLIDRSAAHRLPVSLGYGMTETAAMVTALRPEERLGGDRTSGRPLPHVRLTIEAGGAIALETESLFRGYYPDFNPGRRFVTADLGRLDHGRLLVLGRHDGAINTGGEKVQPAEIEAVLRGTGEFDDVAVLGLPHPEWGQVVVAAYEAGRRPNFAVVDTLLAAQLAPAKRPKRFVALPDWPRTAAGKLDRARLPRMVEERLKAP